MLRIRFRQSRCTCSTMYATVRAQAHKTCTRTCIDVHKHMRAAPIHSCICKHACMHCALRKHTLMYARACGMCARACTRPGRGNSPLTGPHAFYVRDMRAALCNALHCAMSAHDAHTRTRANVYSTCVYAVRRTCMCNTATTVKLNSNDKRIIKLGFQKA